MRVERLHRLLLHAYPPAFRRRYGAAMSDAFHAGCVRARQAGTLRRFLVRATVDVIANAALEWRDAAVRAVLHPAEELPRMFWQSTWMDVRYATRLLVRAPGFTALAAAAFALGIGANTAIFTIVNAVLLRPLPYAEPDRLVMIWATNPARGGQPSAMTEGDVIDIGRAVTTVSRFEAFQANVIPVQLTAGRNTMVARAVSVTPDTFALLGRPPLLGRTLRAGDRSVMVLSHGFWQRQFGGDPAVIGREVIVGSRPAQIVAVMPADFGFPYRSMLLAPISFTRSGEAEVWVPMTLAAARAANDSLRIFGALAATRPGAGVEQVRAEVASIAGRLAKEHPQTHSGWSATAVAAHGQAVDATRPLLLLLLAGVGLVLLMACVNVANLLLARSVRRQREMAVRAALGAARARLVRQAIVESVLLASLGGIAAWLVVEWTIRAFVALAPAEVPRLAEITPDWRSALYAGAVTLVAGVATGLVPAFTASRVTVQNALVDSARGSTPGRGRRLRSTLVAVEVALALVLAIGAGLLTRSFIAVLAVDPGFRTEGLLTLQVSVPLRYDTPAKRLEFYRQLFERLEALPGVMVAGGTTRLPLGGANSSTQVTIDGREPNRGGLVDAGLRRALHDYFPAMGMSIVRGRGFDRSDGPDAPAVVIINETMARQVFPGEDPVGRRVRLGDNAGVGAATIVGVVSDVRHSGLEAAPEPEIYIHYLQNPPVAPLVVLRLATDAATVAESVRRAVHDLDPAVRLFDVRTMADLRAEAVAQRQSLTLLAALFGVLALTLATVGVFGVMSLVVSERTREVGIRLALGAAPARVLGLIVGQGLTLAGAGVLAGLVAAIGLMPLMASQLYGVAAIDAATLAGVPALLLGVALLACLIPARRAMRVDPVRALRYE